SEWASMMQRFSEQRAGFQREIVEMGHDYGDDVDESGSATAALHRGWIALKDALTGDDAAAVLGAAVTGEDHAVSEYDDALDKDLSDGFREVVTRQRAAVVAARDEVKALQNVD
ncbi:MAG: PA2169 family four-helix-bundle protein, partial [Nocardioides sp.]